MHLQFIEPVTKGVFKLGNEELLHRKLDQANHIKNAYVKKTVKEGETQSSKEVKLSKGNYVYFCPLNPTPQYKFIVE